MTRRNGVISAGFSTLLDSSSRMRAPDRRASSGARGLPRSTPAACCGSGVPKRAFRRRRGRPRRRIAVSGARCRRPARAARSRVRGLAPASAWRAKNGENRFCVTPSGTCWFSTSAPPFSARFRARSVPSPPVRSSRRAFGEAPGPLVEWPTPAESDAGGASRGVVAMFEKILIDLAALATIASFALAVAKEWKARADDEGEKRNRR